MSLASKEITLVQKVEKEVDGRRKVTREEYDVDIYEAEFDSIDRIMSSVGGLLEELQHLPQIDALFDVFVDRSQAVKNYEWTTKENTNERKKEVDEVIAAQQAEFNESIKQNIFPILHIALAHAPQRVFTVLSALTDLTETELRQQPLSSVPDILDAVVEVNDIPKLAERVKNSLTPWIESIKRGNQTGNSSNLEAVKESSQKNQS